MTPEEKIDYYIRMVVKAMAVTGSLLSLVILADYLLPGTTVTESVEWKAAETSSSHRSRHLAFRVDTPNRYFYCGQDFFAQLTDADTVTLQLSPWFSAVNSYASSRFMPEPHTFTLRYATALLLPLCMWAVTIVFWKLSSPVFQFLVFIGFVLNLITFIMLV